MATTASPVVGSTTMWTDRTGTGPVPLARASTVPGIPVPRQLPMGSRRPVSSPSTVSAVPVAVEVTPASRFQAPCDAAVPRRETSGDNRAGRVRWDAQ